jgi:thioredoxin-related protein
MKEMIFLLVISLVINLNYIYSKEIHKSDTTSARIKFDPTREPEKDLRNSVTEAKKFNKRIILDIGGEWCIWCHRLDEFLERNDDLKNFLHENYIVMKVNFSPENKNEKFLSKYPKINGYPHIFILEKDGRLLYSKDTGELEKGRGYDHDKMFAFLKEWAPKNDEDLIK